MHERLYLEKYVQASLFFLVFFEFFEFFYVCMCTLIALFVECENAESLQNRRYFYVSALFSYGCRLCVVCCNDGDGTFS
jgi:hypothetical protein